MGKRRNGFTLIELLCVLAIMAVLMGIIIPATQAAREAGRRARAVNELQQLNVAIATAKSEMGARYVPSHAYVMSSYDLSPPPSSGGTNVNYYFNLEALNNLRTFFGPRFGYPDPANPNIIKTDLPDWGNIYGSQCLVFFLGGYRDGGFTAGFAPGSKPFASPASQFKPVLFFNFQLNRLYNSPNGGPPVYVDPWADGKGAMPYFYFSTRRGGDYADPTRQHNKNGVCWYPAGSYTNMATGETFALPAVISSMPLIDQFGKYVDMSGWQLISAGKDHAIGQGGNWVPGQGQYTQGQAGWDDHANFQLPTLGIRD